ncbi:MAG: T9SS type A sorting domain-containing protein [Bacteroidetes bacterium]|nr:T9SS type A sorting domain-containing protein [Bacteroidota bacterium]
MKKLLLLILGSSSFANAQVTMTVNTSASAQKTISPYIYGLNGYVYDNQWTGPWATGLSNHGGLANLLSLNITSWRLGGNATTAYNWENGANNAGVDDSHKNSSFQSYIVSGQTPAPAPTYYTPARAAVLTHSNALSLNAVSLIQLPMAGYVGADVLNTVCGTPTATPSRWIQVVNTKTTALSLAPTLTDNVMYVDEEINFLKNQFGSASTANGIKFYQTDNEVGLWSLYKVGGGVDGTHSVMHPAFTTCNEVINKTYALAKTIKQQDPAAKVFSSGRWGYAEAYSLWNVWDAGPHQPSDWATFNVEPYKTNGTGVAKKYNRMTWQNAFLANMKQKEILDGIRYLDVLAIHYYPEGISTNADIMQAPRSLWDTTYVENSWITANGNGFTDGAAINMLPLTQKAINDFYPGTKLAITEYDFTGRNIMEGAIAQADALGIFAKCDVYWATYFGIADSYIGSGFRLFRNYDGANNKFGNLLMPSSTSNNALTSIYASVDNTNPNLMHVVLLNKGVTTTTANINFAGTTNYNSIISAYGLTEADASTAITAKPAINALTSSTLIVANNLSYVMQPKSMYHLLVNTTTVTALIQNNQEELFAKVFPNPVSSSLQISTNLNLQSVSLLETSGKLVLQKLNCNAKSLTLDISTMQKGLYILNCKSSDGKELNKKIVIE